MAGRLASGQTSPGGPPEPVPELELVEPEDDPDDEPDDPEELVDPPDDPESEPSEELEPPPPSELLLVHAESVGPYSAAPANPRSTRVRETAGASARDRRSDMMLS
jgi:hypothetical protein